MVKSFEANPSQFDHRELAKRGVTLTLLWEEYRRKCYNEGKKPYPYARIKQRKYIMSPGDLTKSVRFSGLFFLLGKCIQEGHTKQQFELRKGVSI